MECTTLRSISCDTRQAQMPRTCQGGTRRAFAVLHRLPDAPQHAAWRAGRTVKPHTIRAGQYSQKDSELRTRRNFSHEFSRVNPPPQAALYNLPHKWHYTSYRVKAELTLKHQSPLASCNTSWAWPLTLTLRQTWRTTPASSTRKVERSIPMNLRPYILFSTQTP